MVQVLTFLKGLFSEKQREIIRYWLYSIPAFFYRNNLTKLAKLYGTDKYEHGYTSIYQDYFHEKRKQKLRILEIGIGGGENTKYGGNSLKMWAKFFPKSKILGIDIYDKSLLDYRQIKTYKGNQTDEKFLAQFENLDIIIDDGSHINSDIITSFETLYTRLNVGGYYCVEDTQVSGLPEFTKASHPIALSYFKHLKLDNAQLYFYAGLIIIHKEAL